MAGCLYEIPDKIIKRFTTQELFRKYLKFKKNSLYYENLKKGLIPCIHPDCEEWIKYKEGDDMNILNDEIKGIKQYKFIYLNKKDLISGTPILKKNTRE